MRPEFTRKPTEIGIEIPAGKVKGKGMRVGLGSLPDARHVSNHDIDAVRDRWDRASRGHGRTFPFRRMEGLVGIDGWRSARESAGQISLPIRGGDLRSFSTRQAEGFSRFLLRGQGTLSPLKFFKICYRSLSFLAAFWQDLR